MPEKDAEKEPRAGSEHDTASALPLHGQEQSVADIAKELAVTKDRLLRSLAEQENIRNQARRDRDEAVKYAAAGFASDLLSVVDNLERAIASAPKDKESDPVIAGLLTGVEATRRSLVDAFTKHGIKRLDPIGEPFDPHKHEASFAAADPRYSPGTVTNVIQPGYVHHDRLLRPALVGVNTTSGDAPAKPVESRSKSDPS
ncbi:molecular chaperone GrpE [Rhizobium leguminosarum]|uniref:Protein GrpE n=2 Tax=Rhizobium TaxID=379 RepID=A0A7X0DU26_RHILE|nr:MULTISPECIES: nucleotide exchange factor GrpE [Rhizobium]MBB5662735.1 molecular chaperone GrpE [Rhizobium leguminosarum]MBB6222329.1 molecular chaperone GrpE [Rhizobium leguminosarum]NYJ09125.1 molecular chaperone GrpE [Rhizobium leguminosarum]QAS78457.1 nucleotide exchange factor GrpE [Rhizobium acidisoli]